MERKRRRGEYWKRERDEERRWEYWDGNRRGRLEVKERKGNDGRGEKNNRR